MGPCYGPLSDFGGVLSRGPCFAYGTLYMVIPDQGSTFRAAKAHVRVKRLPRNQWGVPLSKDLQRSGSPCRCSSVSGVRAA